jgi:polysaccharide export outer membrane protein
VSLKRVKYLQDVSEYQKDNKIEFNNETGPAYIVQPGDNLYVDVSSLDSKNLNPFEANQRISYQNNSEMSVYLNSYMVSDSGFINFPVVGKIAVAGLNVNEVKSKIQATINDFFQLTTVTVKLVNFKISLLGEVTRPGTFLVYQESINILQAISMAGDLLPYANRSKIMIIRKSGRGTTVHKINLLEASIFESPYYYLQPDDIVYIEPLNSKNYAFTAFPYTVIFTTITTTLLILNFIK